MTTTVVKRPVASATIGLLLIVPALLFVSASLLKYELGVPLLYDSLGFLASPPRLGLYNILSPFLFLGGPTLAVLLNLPAILHVRIEQQGGELTGSFRLRPRGLNAAVVATGLVLLGILLAYLVVENLGVA